MADSLRDRLSPRAARGLVALAIVATTLTAAVVGVTGGTAGAAAPNLVYVNEPFTGSNVLLPDAWTLPGIPSGGGTNHACMTASTNTSQTPIPGCDLTPPDGSGSGTLRLTGATTNEDAGVAYTTAVPSAQGIDINFQTFQYGGSGADGILFFLAGTNPSSPTPPATLGEYGGHLGYSGGTGSPTGNGLANGYLGVGFDVYGNYTNNNYDGTGCSDPSWAGKGATVPNQVTVRGPGSGTSGYCLLSSTNSSGGLNGNLGTGATGTRATSLVPAEIAINPTATPLTTSSGLSVPADSYLVAVTPIGAARQIIGGLLPSAAGIEPSSWLDPANGIPYQLAFGFAGSTGSSTDVHEVRNVQLAPLTTNTPRFGLGLSDNSAGQWVQSPASGPPSVITFTATPSVSSSGGPEGQTPSFTTTLPTGLTPGTATGTQWSCTTTGQTVSCSYTGTLPVAAGTILPTISIPATVASNATGTLSVTGYLTSDGSVAASATDTGTAASSFATNPILGIGLTDSAGGAFTQGGSFTYLATTSVSAAGTNESAAPTLADTFPAGVTPGTATGTNWTCTTTGQQVGCTYKGTLPITAGTTLPVVSMPATVTNTATGAISNTATVSSTDAKPSSASATDTGSVLAVPQYALTYTDNESGNFPSPTPVGSPVVYTATAKVLSTSEPDAPTFTVTLPTGVTPGTATGTNWTCTTTGQQVSCTYSGTLPIAAGTTLPAITFNGVVASGLTTGTNLSSTGFVSSSDAFPASATDLASAKAAPAPTITSVAPSQGPTTGGTSVTITGTGFTGASAVTFGGTNATTFSVVSATQITATTPAGPAGAVNVAVTNTTGTANYAGGFTYVPPAPTVTGISPTQGPAAGGTTVTITGTNFTGAGGVSFGGIPAGSYSVVSATQATATSPAGTGTVDVTVTTPGGTSATSSADKFTYVPAPTVSGLSPTQGPAAGNTTVTITGTGFTGASAVSFGGTAALSYSVVSATEITAKSPVGTGTVDVTVTTVGGTSATSSADQFTYIAAPTVTWSLAHAGPDRRRHHGDHHRDQLHRGQRGQLRGHRRPVLQRGQRHRDHGQEPGRDRDRRRHRDDAGRHFGHLERRQVHLRRRPDGERPLAHAGPGRRQHHGDHHRDRVHRGQRGQFRGHRRPVLQRGQRHRRSRPRARRGPARSTSP